jgi:hypothetical protein
MKHLIFTRMRFDDMDLMSKYLAVTKKTLIPSLKSQTNKNFTWVLMIRKDDEEFLRSELDYPFTAVYDVNGFINLAIGEKFEIQTRHDCDDNMSPNYIQKLQEIYEENKDIHACTLIHCQPKQIIYQTGEVRKLGAYHDKRTSMHLTICQKNVKHHVYQHQHGQMWKIAQRVILLPEGYTEWVIHGNNISVNKNRK